MHLLIAEDAALSRRIIEHILKSHGGYEITFAEDGETAWRMLSAHPGRYDAVLLDLIMPGLGGFEVLERIRGHSELAKKPVLLCTAMGDRTTVTQAARLAVEHYVVKPYRKEVLLEKLATIEKQLRCEPIRREPVEVVCERLGVDEEVYGELVKDLHEATARWLAAAKTVRPGDDLDELIIKANGLWGTAMSLGESKLATGFQLAELNLTKLREAWSDLPKDLCGTELAEAVLQVREAHEESAAPV
jgi:two-component system chemotaxis response regulator CheY